MIKSLGIGNFQSHKETDLEFSEGVNIIVGPSDSGKSSILRAINWPINNRPSGEAFKSNWEGETFVDLELDNEVVISREKGKDNLYVISGHEGKEPVEFKAFGQGVPDEIKQELQMSEINIQYQLDAPFLLSNSPGEVARYLNNIVKLDKIDSSLSNISKWLRQEQGDLKRGIIYLTELKDQERQYNWLDQADGQLTNLEGLIGQISDKNNKSTDLLYIINNISDINIEKVKIQLVLKAELQLIKLQTLEAEILKIRASKEKAISLYRDLENIDSRLCNIRILTDLSPKIEPLLTLNRDIDKLTDKAENLEGLIDDISDIQTKKIHRGQQLEMMQKEFDDLMPDTCPLCGQGIKPIAKRRRK